MEMESRNSNTRFIRMSIIYSLTYINIYTYIYQYKRITAPKLLLRERERHKRISEWEYVRAKTFELSISLAHMRFMVGFMNESEYYRFVPDSNAGCTLSLMMNFDRTVRFWHRHPNFCDSQIKFAGRNSVYISFL